jgi:hypothetical protein
MHPSTGPETRHCSEANTKARSAGVVTEEAARQQRQHPDRQRSLHFGPVFIPNNSILSQKQKKFNMKIADSKRRRKIFHSKARTARPLTNEPSYRRSAFLLRVRHLGTGAGTGEGPEMPVSKLNLCETTFRVRLGVKRTTLILADRRVSPAKDLRSRQAASDTEHNRPPP